MNDALPNTLTRSDQRSLVGLLVATLLGALAAALMVGVWSLLVTVLGGYDARVPLGWALLTGALMGVIVGSWRRRRDTPPAVAVATGAVAGLTWLLLAGFKPLGLSVIAPFWGIAGCLLAFVLSGHLTRYALRGQRLDDVTRYTLEVLLVRVLRAFGFAFFLFVVVFPFYFMVVSSFKSRAAMLQNPTHLSVDLGQGWTQLVSGYREVLFTFDFLRYIGNSTLVASVTVLITLVLAILGAYAVTRLRFRGRTFMSRAILLIYMFPAIVLVIPLYSVFTQLGLRDTLPGLLIIYPATTIPVALYMLRSYFQTLPQELEEAGLIDGCSRFAVIWRITLPLSVPALASVGLYVFMIAWNEFLFAFMFLDSPDIFTLSRGMAALNNQEVPRQYLMAGAVIVTVPIMVLFFWFEKYLIGGLTAGGVKG